MMAYHSRLTIGILLTLLLVVFATADSGQFCTGRGQPVVASGCTANSNVCLSTIRGGEEDDPEAMISEFLSQATNSLDGFHIHGWRWHTMSLVREAGRLQKLAERRSQSDDDECTPLKQAAEYVVGFNLKGLHKIETDLFFPWMRQKLTSIQQNHLASAFGTVMDQLESDRKKVAELGESIQQKVSLLCNDSSQETSSSRSQAILGIAQDSAALEQCARSMMERENSLLVPAIAQVVSESEQKSFNNKVLRNLGLLDSRLHLVGMHEAVWESNIAKEKELFEKAIPSIPQMMIPRWKRNLYLPRTDVLEQQS